MHSLVFEDYLSSVGYATASTLIQASSWAGLVYTTCEWIYNFSFELKSVWKGPTMPLYLRCIYLASRYIGLFAQVAHLVAFNYLQRVTTASRLVCSLYWFLQLFVGAISLLMLQVILSKRVLVLWSYDSRIKVLLLFLFMLDSGAIALFGGISTFQRLQYDGKCYPGQNKTLKEVMYLCSIEIAVQIILWTLIVLKCVSIRQEARKSVSILSHISRESFLILVFACVAPVLVVADGIWTRLVPRRVTNATYLVFPMCLSTITSVTCRTIINMHELLEGMSGRGRSGEGLVLTSVDAEN